jgi:hypothetical protein
MCIHLYILTSIIQHDPDDYPILSNGGVTVPTVIGITSLSIFFCQCQNCDPVTDAHSSPMSHPKDTHLFHLFWVFIDNC